ncbi:hypothetical protein MASR1M45_04430 [Candidatus Kapaibacterium sp.]
MKKIILVLLGLILSNNLIANNLQIGEVTKSGQNTSQKYVMLNFDVQWENSWRLDTDVPPGNYDAVWLFVKYFRGGGWHHAKLSSNASEFNSGTNAEIKTTADGMGVFLQRKVAGSGTFNTQNISLRWNYGFNNELDDSIPNMPVIVMGIEMVYVSEGPFWIGGGGIQTFYTYPNTNEFFRIINESIDIDLKMSNDYLWVTDCESEGVIPNSFPKGVKSFYCMKYEVTQKQFATFLNTLTQTQSQNRFVDKYGNYRFYIRKIENRYGCDANDNNIFDEDDDGCDIACNFISIIDFLAFSDWAGLRPMSTFEYEKVCRGPDKDNSPWAWGSNDISMVTSILNNGLPNEISNDDAHTYIPNCNLTSPSQNNPQVFSGPTRVGMFAKANGGRVESGASFFGVMDMTGNLWEIVVSPRYNISRIFNKVNGDGALNSIGQSDIETWNIMFSTETCCSTHSLKGGSFFANPYANTYYISSVGSFWNFPGHPFNKENNYGIRCVRSAE